jgi:hypothetical protein
MKVPSIQPVSFDRGFALFGAKPFALAHDDFALHYHCDGVALQSAAPELLGTSLRIAERVLRIECEERGIVIPPVSDGVLSALSAELLEAGPAWDAEIAKRLKTTPPYKAYHAVFDDWAKKKPRPELAFHGASRMFRIFELVLQPL